MNDYIKYYLYFRNLKKMMKLEDLLTFYNWTTTHIDMWTAILITPVVKRWNFMMTAWFIFSKTIYAQMLYHPQFKMISLYWKFFISLHANVQKKQPFWNIAHSHILYGGKTSLKTKVQFVPNGMVAWHVIDGMKLKRKRRKVMLPCKNCLKSCQNLEIM